MAAYPSNYGPLDSIGVPMHAFAYTPSDSTQLLDGTLEVVSRAVTARTDGNMKVTYVGSTTPVTVPMIAGFPHSMQVNKIWATDTTVTGGVVVEY